MGGTLAILPLRQDDPVLQVLHLAYSQVPTQPAPDGFNGVQVPAVWGEVDQLQAMALVELWLLQEALVVLPHLVRGVSE